MKTFLTITFVLGCFSLLWAQTEKKSVVIGALTSKPNALLIVNPERADQGVLLPQLSTSQRTALMPASPAEDGLIVFDSDLQAYFYWSRNAWVKLGNDNIPDPPSTPNPPYTPKTSFHNIDPAVFQELKTPQDVRYDNIVMFEADNTFITASRDANQQMIAPVQLPHGAVMKELKIHYLDNSRSNIKLYFLRKAWDGESEQLLSWESSGASGTPTSQLITHFNGFEVIDLEQYTYRLIVQFDIEKGHPVESPDEVQQRLYGIRIKYEE